MSARRAFGFPHQQAPGFPDIFTGVEAILARYPTDLVLVRHTDPVEAGLAARKAWRPVYRDDAFTLFARPGLDLPVVDRSGVRLLGSYP